MASYLVVDGLPSCFPPMFVLVRQPADPCLCARGRPVDNPRPWRPQVITADQVEQPSQKTIHTPLHHRRQCRR